MLSKILDRRMNPIRVVLAGAWMLLILSLIHDPLSLELTDANYLSSPFHVHLDVCVPFQNSCIRQIPYGFGNGIFWSIIVPLAVLILLVFGHETWRRICPLAFISQLPRRFGWQRTCTIVNSKTGKTTQDVPKISQDSWLGRNYPFMQFSLLFVGLCCRLLFLNGNSMALAVWLIGTIIAATVISYLYAGKPWCQYICPMAPVQRIFAEPGGIITSRAHLQETGTVTQSMCRTTDQTGRDKSACVACQKFCIDIDAEKGYWETITQPKQRLQYYGYFGLVVGFFAYHYLYAGNWAYYFSGIWAQQGGELQQLLEPGFYIAGQVIAIPKLIAVPLFLGFCCLCSYGIGSVKEQGYQRYLSSQKTALSQEEILHRLYSAWTVISFNMFFAFAGRPLINRLPVEFQNLETLFILAISLLWLYRMQTRSPGRYSKEKLALKIKKQMVKLEIPLSKWGYPRSLRHATPKQMQTLAKALPNYEPDQALLVYKTLLHEMLENLDDALTTQLMMAQLSLYHQTATSMLASQLAVADVQSVKPDLGDQEIIRKRRSDGQSSNSWHQGFTSQLSPPEQIGGSEPYHKPGFLTSAVQSS